MTCGNVCAMFESALQIESIPSDHDVYVLLFIATVNVCIR